MNRRHFLRNGLWVTAAALGGGVKANPFGNLMASRAGGLVSFRALAGNGSTTNAVSYATSASYTPAPNALILACVINTKASTPDTPTFAGNGLTWVQVVTGTAHTIASPTMRMTIFRAMGSSPTAGVGTASFSGITQTGGIVNIVEFSGTDTSGTNGSGAIVQAPAIAQANTTTNPSITLAALTGSANAVVGFAAHNNNSTAYGAVESVDWTEINELAYNTPATGLVSIYRLATTDNTIVITGASSNWLCGGIEIKAA
jgi:hypothetical protein